MSEGAVKIHWSEAEKLTGRRLDRRVAYCRYGDRVMVYPLTVRSIGEMERHAAKFWDEHPHLEPSSNSFDRPVVESPQGEEERFNLRNLVEI